LTYQAERNSVLCQNNYTIRTPAAAAPGLDFPKRLNRVHLSMPNYTIQ